MEESIPVKERLFQLCDALGVSPNQFSQQIGKSREFVRKITGEIGSDVLRNIFREYPNTNLIWIITGEGSMFLENGVISPKSENLTSFLIDENKNLQEENKRLIKENALLSVKLELALGSNTQNAI